MSIRTVQPDATLQAHSRRGSVRPATAVRSMTATPMAASWPEARPVHVRKQRADFAPCLTATLVDPGAKGGRAP